MSPFRIFQGMERFLLPTGRQFLNLATLISVHNPDNRIAGKSTVFVKQTLNLPGVNWTVIT